MMDNKTQKELAIYNFAKGCIGKHMTLDPNVPSYYGCAEALSANLKGVGYKLPNKGIQGTKALEGWVVASGQFEKIAEAEMGALVFSSTEGETHGHCGIVGRKDGVAIGVRRIMSNNSDSGLWLDLWHDGAWRRYYVGSLGLEMTFYRAKDSC